MGRAPPTELCPGWGRPGSSRTSSPGAGTRRHQGGHARLGEGLGSPTAPQATAGAGVRFDVPATAAALVAQCWRGRAVHRPVRERATLARLGARRQRGAKGARDVARAGSGSGLAWGTTGVCLGNTMTSNVSKGEDDGGNGYAHN